MPIFWASSKGMFMITVVIAKDEKGIRKVLMEILHKEGYAVSESPDKDGAIRILAKGGVSDASSLKDTVVELGDSLYREKHGVLYKTILETIERPLIERILERTEGNQLKAARILGINRNTMRTKIKKLG